MLKFLEIMKFPLQSLPILRGSAFAQLFSFSQFETTRTHTLPSSLTSCNENFTSFDVRMVFQLWFLVCDGTTCSIFVNIRTVATLPAAWSQNEIEANPNIHRSRFQNLLKYGLISVFKQDFFAQNVCIEISGIFHLNFPLF